MRIFSETLRRRFDVVELCALRVVMMVKSSGTLRRGSSNVTSPLAHLGSGL